MSCDWARGEENKAKERQTKKRKKTALWLVSVNVRKGENRTITFFFWLTRFINFDDFGFGGHMAHEIRQSRKKVGRVVVDQLEKTKVIVI